MSMCVWMDGWGGSVYTWLLGFHNVILYVIHVKTKCSNGGRYLIWAFNELIQLIHKNGNHFTPLINRLGQESGTDILYPVTLKACLQA